MGLLPDRLLRLNVLPVDEIPMSLITLIACWRRIRTNLLKGRNAIHVGDVTGKHKLRYLDLRRLSYRRHHHLVHHQHKLEMLGETLLTLSEPILLGTIHPIAMTVIVESETVAQDTIALDAVVEVLLIGTEIKNADPRRMKDLTEEIIEVEVARGRVEIPREKDTRGGSPLVEVEI